MKEKKKTEAEESDDVYDSKNAEEMLEDDELEPKEVGFMEGYNQKQSESGKKPKKIVQEK